jgi:aspartate/methionine/tyrosine aminotransferase
VPRPEEPPVHPAAGLPELRDAIAMKTKRDSGFDCSAAQVLVTNGGKHAVFTAFATLCDPGDEVLCPTPYWTDVPRGDHARRAAHRCRRDGRVDRLQGDGRRARAGATPKTKALLFVSPDNPSGAVYSPEQVEAIGRWAVENQIWVLTDEIYEHLVYDDNEFVSMPTVVPELTDHCVIVNGVAKTYAMTGWRVGWMIGPPDVMKAA